MFFYSTHAIEVSACGRGSRVKIEALFFVFLFFLFLAKGALFRKGTGVTGWPNRTDRMSVP